MASVYFDTSAIVKMLIEEEGSALAGSLWREADRLFASRLAYPECRAALASGARIGRLTADRHRAAKVKLDDLWRAVDIVVGLTSEVGLLAGDLVEQFPLSGPDAVHLATALAASRGDVLFATWDRQLARAAAAAGLGVAPPPA